MPKQKNITCTICGYKNALSVTEKDRKTLYYCHAGCDSKEVWRAHIGKQIIERSINPKIHKTNISSDILKFWSRAEPIQGTTAETYLCNRKISTHPDSLRFSPSEWSGISKNIYPCMIAAVTDYNGHLRAIHRTFLAQDGSAKADIEAPRMTLGEVAGLSVHLAEASFTMAVSEGIETGLSFMQLSGVPTWAALSTGGMKNLILPPLPLATEVIIAADNDIAGNYAAQEAAYNWALQGRKVKVVRPPKDGADFNDLLMEQYCGK